MTIASSARKKANSTMPTPHSSTMAASRRAVSKIVGREQDDVAEPGLRGDELAQHHADHGEGHADPQAAEDVRQGEGELHRQEHF